MVNSFPVDIRTRKITNGQQQVVFYPQAANMKDQKFQWSINQAIVKQAQQMIDKQMKNMPAKVETMNGSYEIKNNQRQVLSLTQSNYTYHQQAANGMTYLQSLTFDLKKKNECKLKDLFKPGSNYVTRLTDLIKLQIKERDINTIGEFNKIRPDQDFYIADKTIVIYFQLFEITPHYFGFPMFPISVYNLQDIIDENGPLGRMATND